jgi:PTS system mannose-specific IIA component
MTRILIVAHAPLASALRDVASHAYPECAAGIEALDVGPSSSTDDVESRLRSQLQARPEEPVLILVDAFGATPCNAAQRVADGDRVRVVAGVSVPMLWRTLCYRSEALDSLVQRAVVGAAQGAMHVAVPRRQNQSLTAGAAAHDQDEHHHQQ